MALHLNRGIISPSLLETLCKLVSRGDPLELQAQTVQEGGEWFHLTPGVRAVIQAAIADDAD